MDVTVEQFKHESWRSMIGMGVGYLGLLLLVTVVLFLVPFFVFAL
ncbi:MAG: hypothetical protein ACOCY6_01770 [Halodesulfurarchaeum sp.]